VTSRVRRRSACVVVAIATGLSGIALIAAGRGGRLVQQPAAAPASTVEPGLEAVVRAFFATQEAEDAAGYLALWSRTARAPSAAALKFIFDSGDDRYNDISILRADTIGVVTRVRVTATRDRTFVTPAGPGPTMHTQYVASLLMIKENGEWRLVGEGSAVDDLAGDLLSAPDAAARETLLRESPTLITRQLVDAISRRANDLIRGRQFAAAQTVFERALEIARRIGDRKVEGEALQNLGNALYFQRNFARALEVSEQGLSLERERNDPEAIASALVGVGNVRYALAEYATALSKYREALTLQESLADHSAAASTLINTGNVRYLLGDYPAAIADYHRSREWYRELGDNAGASFALGGLGRVYAAQGDLAAAIEAFSGVLADGKARNDRPAQGSALMSLGDVHLRLGNLSAARSALEEARGHFEALSDGANLGRAWQSIAMIDLLGGSYAAAERGYSRSGEICRNAADLECAASAAVGLGFAQATQDKFSEAVASYTQGVSAFTALKHPEQAARAEIGLAQAQTGLGRYDDALAAAARARQTAISLSLDDVLWRAQIAEAQVHRKSGAIDRALGAARAALYAVDELRETARAQPGSPLPRDTSAAFAMLARLQADTGDAAGAFDTSERMRVHDLRAALIGNEREIARGMTPVERDAERTTAAEIISIRAQITRERGLPRPDAARLAEFERRLTAAVSARATEQEQLFTRLPDLAGWRGMFAPCTITDLTQVLGSGEVLLDFIMDEDALVGLAAWVDEGKVVAVARTSTIGRRALGEAVARMLLPATLKDAAIWRQAIAPVFDALPPQALERLANAPRVFVVPHEFLWRVPFEALPIGDEYLGQRAAVTYLSSLSARLGAGGADAGPVIPLVAIGAPDIAPAMSLQLAQSAPDWTIRSADAATRELDAVSAGRDSEHVVRLSGATARKSAVRESLSGAGVIHFATPFRLSRGSVLFSSMLLTPPSGEPPPAGFAAADTMFDLRDVMNATSNARLVVFSDGGALSRRDAASEAGTLQWAWRAAGVRTVVLSRWTSEDTADAAFLQELHRQIADGRAVHEAELKARQAVRRSADWAAPFYWSGWIGIGQ